MARTTIIYFVVAIAAVLVYLYIYLSISTGPPLKGTAPTSPLITSSTRLRLFRIAANLWCSRKIRIPNFSPNHLLCSGELPLTLTGQRRVAYNKVSKNYIIVSNSRRIVNGIFLFKK